MDADTANERFAARVDEAVNQREVRQALEKEPHPPAAETSSVSASNQEIRADLPSLDDHIALRAMDVYSMYSLPVRVRSMNPLVVWGASAGSRIAVLGRPTSTPADSGGE